jgi:hypothetical protein
VLILGTSREYIRIPVTAPAGVDVTLLAAEIALVADPGTEPVDADYHAATWIAGEACLLAGAGGAVDYPDGEYMAYLRLTAGAERPVLRAGRVRVGDARS